MKVLEDLIDVDHPNTQLGDIALPGGKTQLKSDGTGIDEKHDGITITPSKGFVIKTVILFDNNAECANTGSATQTARTDNEHQNKLFINVCYHNAIEKSSTKKKLDSTGKEVEGLNLPLSMGPIRSCNDKLGSACLAVDAIVHPSVQDGIDRDGTGSKRDFVCQVLMQCFEQKYLTDTNPHKDHGGPNHGDTSTLSSKQFMPQGHLDRKYKLPRLRYFGYVDTMNGKVVRKESESEHAEVCKQTVRDTSRRPVIEELSSCDARTSHKKQSHSTKAMEKGGATKTIPKRPPLQFQIYVKLTTGAEVSIDDFLVGIHTDEKYRKQDDKMDLLPHVSTKWDRNLPLLIDPDSFQGHTVTHVIAKAMTPMKACSQSLPSDATVPDLNSMVVELSAYALFVTSLTEAFARTECILPFCINTTEAMSESCTLGGEIFQLCISAPVLLTSMEDAADVGSQPWLLAKALSSTSDDEAMMGSEGKKECRYNEDNNVNESDGHRRTKMNASMEEDDPYQLQSPFPWKRDAASYPNAQNSGRKEVPGETNFPEDQFHAQDSISQYIIEQQEAERQDKIKRGEEERKARQDNADTDADGSMEYLHIEDFKPGGKYCEMESSPSTGNKSHDKDVVLAAEVDVEHDMCLKKAESMLKTCEANPFQNDLWYRLL